jgi:hypothetical protein
MDKKTVISKKNPIIPRMGVCDPHMHVFNGRVWLHATHDAIPGSSYFSMHDWQIWSSADCVEWQLESVVRPEDFHMGPSSDCWAVDCEERNGKYYYYFSDGNMRTGVGVGDSPAGPFKDVLGKPLLDGTLTTTREYDPCVFKDDDGEYYLVFGGPSWCYGEGCGYFIARLNEDMVSFAETPRRLEVNHPADDKASLNKFGGRYYLTYGGHYAISDNIYGPYEYKGHTGASEDHTSYFEWNGQIFNAITVFDHYGLYRSAGMCYVHIRDNGDLVTDPLIVEYGVGQYDSDWNRIEAEWFMRGVNVKKAEIHNYPGFFVSCTQEAVLVYPKVRNLSNKTGLSLKASCSGTGGEIELREGNENGRVLGSVRLEKALHIPLPETLPDVTDICLVLKPDPGEEMLLDHFHFYEEAIDNP